jgi:hypothetical protein
MILTLAPGTTARRSTSSTSRRRRSIRRSLRDAWNADNVSPFHGWNQEGRTKPDVA